MTTTTTLDLPPILNLTIQRLEDGNYHVRDWVGLRYGNAPSLSVALDKWWWQIQDLLSMPGAPAEPLTSEIRAYEQALGLIGGQR